MADVEGQVLPREWTGWPGLARRRPGDAAALAESCRGTGRRHRKSLRHRAARRGGPHPVARRPARHLHHARALRPPLRNAPFPAPERRPRGGGLGESRREDVLRDLRLLDHDPDAAREAADGARLASPLLPPTDVSHLPAVLRLPRRHRGARGGRPDPRLGTQPPDVGHVHDQLPSGSGVVDRAPVVSRSGGTVLRHVAGRHRRRRAAARRPGRSRHDRLRPGPAHHAVRLLPRARRRDRQHFPDGRRCHRYRVRARLLGGSARVLGAVHAGPSLGVVLPRARGRRRSERPARLSSQPGGRSDDHQRLARGHHPPPDPHPHGCRRQAPQHAPSGVRGCSELLPLPLAAGIPESRQPRVVGGLPGESRVRVSGGGRVPPLRRAPFPALAATHREPRGPSGADCTQLVGAA